jgi:hypothetical protein
MSRIPQSNRRADVDIIVEDELDFGHDYLIEPIADAWRQSGRRVNIRRLGEPACGQIGFLHINRTRIPAELANVARGYAFSINASVLDQTKRNVSTRLINRGARHDGPVIIKTDANAGGAPDSRKNKKYAGRSRLRDLKLVAQRALPWRVGRTLPHQRYPILPTVDSVPGWVWDRSDLVVEELAIERSDYGYVTRNWLFLGNAERSIICHGKDPVVKRDGTIRVDLSDHVPTEIRALRERLGCNYGKIDWVLTENGPIAFDLNITPTFSAMSARMQGIVRDLSAGLPI